MFTLLMVVLFIFALFVLILTHEAGHFLAAKAVGIKVDQFSIGFGPEITGWTRGETRYSLKWILAGGSVKIAGMNPEEELSEEDLPRSYKKAAYWKRTLVIIAGSGANILVALIILYLIFWPIGYPAPVSNTQIGPVRQTITTSAGKTVEAPSYGAGLKQGDEITAVNGEPVKTWDDLVKQLRSKPSQMVALTVKRGDQQFETSATLLDIDGVGILGISPDTYTKRSNPITAVWDSVWTGIRMMGLLVKGLLSLFSVQNLKILIGTAQRTPASPRSIVGAAQLTVEAARQGLVSYLFIIAEIFIFLAIFNLIPLPPFDGGHLLVIVIEKVFRREVDMRKLMPIAWAVIILLSLVALRLAYLDIFSPLPPP